MQDKNEKALTALAREAGNKSCFSCVGPGSLVRASSEGSFETEIPDARVFSRTTSRARAIRRTRATSWAIESITPESARSCRAFRSLGGDSLVECTGLLD
tara:strand:- start:553 stop:852 length:300 start_codon:yes stop_codon:yes gene_type:complete